MALFNTDSYQEVSIDWLTVTLKNMIITKVGKRVARKDHMGRGARIGLLRTWYKLDNKTR